MLQAITTKFLPMTNSRPMRVKATAAAGSVTLEWDNHLNPEQNHTKAAKAVANKFGWTGEWHGGGLPNGEGYCYVSADIGGHPAFVSFDDRAPAPRSDRIADRIDGYDRDDLGESPDF